VMTANSTVLTLGFRPQPARRVGEKDLQLSSLLERMSRKLRSLPPKGADCAICENNVESILASNPVHPWHKAIGVKNGTVELAKLVVYLGLRVDGLTNPFINRKLG